MENSKRSALLAVLSVAMLMGCQPKTFNTQANSGTARGSSTNQSILEEKRNKLEFRKHFIASHEILSGCDGFPVIAKGFDGSYLISNTGYLGDRSEDWLKITRETPFLHNGNYFMVSEKNGIPIISSSNSKANLSTEVPEGQGRKHCAIFIEASSASILADRWFRNSDEINSTTAQELIKTQVIIQQPILLLWQERGEINADGNPQLKVFRVNISRGLRAVDGLFSSAKGTHEIWPSCQDIFNPTPESSCSSQLDIEIGSSKG
uniref:hypothetical protein n=1 Tax=Cyanobium sp. TaxID=2164130 RepID=UPI0040481FCE